MLEILQWRYTCVHIYIYINSYYSERDSKVNSITKWTNCEYLGKFAGAEWYMYIKCCATWTDHKKKEM